MGIPRAAGALTLLLASGAFAATPAKPSSSFITLAPWNVEETGWFTRSRALAEPWRDEPLIGLLKDVSAGRPFSPEELVILDAYNAGQLISELEAQVLTSRVLYRRYIAGEEIGEKEAQLLGQYKAFQSFYRDRLFQRRSALFQMAGRAIQEPEDSRLYEIYSDPELYNQTDGLRFKLDAKFGKKGMLTQVVIDEPVTGESLFAPPREFQKLGLLDPMAAIVTLQVNNNATVAGAAATQDTQSETSIILGTGGLVLASFNDSGGYNGSTKFHFTGWSRSTDSGATWTDKGELPDQAGGLGDYGDPTMVRSASTGTVLFGTLGDTTLPIWRSTDGGNTFGPTPANGGVTTSANYDKEILAVDNFAGTGQGNFYFFWRNFDSVGGGMTFTRSTDDGLTFANRQVLASGGQGAWPVVGADHAVYAFWLSGTSLVVKKSTDFGVTFGSTVTVATLATTGTNGDLGLGGGFRTNAFPQVVAHPTDGNQLYVVYNDKSGADKGNIYFVKTADGGATWSAPVKVNTDAGTNDQWQPVIAVSPNGTRLFVSWYDRRDSLSNSRFHTYARHASISGTTVTWDANDYKITEADSPVVIGQDPMINTTYMGDYDMAAADNTLFYRTWADNRASNGSHANQPDVRFVSVPLAGPGAIMAANGYSLVSEDCTPANGTVDPNETVTLAFTVKNNGTTATTNLVGTLQASGGVTLPGGPVTFGAVAAGATATQNIAFKAANQACGTSITASLQLQDGATNLGTVTYTIPLFSLGTPVTATYSSGGITVPIPATGTSGNMTDQVINVPDAGSITDVNVKIRLNHTWDSDLTITLVSPNGTPVVLSQNRGSSGDNYGSGTNDCNGTFTIFDDAAANPISSGTAPFAGTFRPEGLLSAMNGGPSNGNWTLKINDNAAGDSGTLYCWQIEVTRATPVCSTTCGSADLSITNTAAPSPNVYQGGTVTYTYVSTNNGPADATDVKIDTTVPAGTTFLSASAPGASSVTTPAVGGTGAVNATWAGTTTNGGTHQLTMTVSVPTSTAVGTVITNTATTSYTGGTDPTPANNTAPSSVTVAAPSLPILAPVTAQTANEGATATFTVVATGPGPFAYQWFQDGAGAIPGATGPTLNVTAYQWLNGATFYCLVTNAYGIMTSNHAALTVIPAGFSATSFSPASGPVGAVVNFYGGDFTGVSSVTFNGTPAAFSVINPGWMQATVPPGATTGYVWLTSPLGTEIPSTMFTVSTAGPVVSSFSPSFGVGGTTVVITGTGFTGATAVKFNGVNATVFTVNSATQITAKVPVYTTSGPITVVTPLGSGTSSTSFVKF